MLIPEVKRKLRITYEDDEVDERVKEIVAQGEADLRDLLAIGDEDFDFSEPGPEQALLLSWCFYEWNDALDDFQVNYAQRIAQLRDKWLARSNAQEKAAEHV